MENMYTFLELTREEVNALKIALSIRLNDLRFEMARTEDHSYRKDLLQQLECLERIENELMGSPQAKQAA